MSLVEKAKTRLVVPRLNPIDRWLETLDDAEREAAEWMLTHPIEWPQRLIIDAFAEEGLPVGKETIGNWRRAHNVSR